MPIANCIVTPECKQNEQDLIDVWARESGQPPHNMTVNITYSSLQIGNRYGAMATLFLPSLWSQSAISSLQVGLAVALAKTFNLSVDEVHVITSIVKSGLVVESGKVEEW